MSDRLVDDRLVGGRFRLLAALGRGNSGQLWHAADEQSGRPVAVKLYHGQSGPGPAVPVANPHAVSIFSAGTHEGVPYVVMELVDGVSLATVLDEGPLDQADAVAIAIGINLALRTAHAAGVVHGNLKPSNVLIADRGVVKVGDFTGHGDPREDMYALGLLMEAMSGRRDPVVKRLLSRDPYPPAQLHEILTGVPAADAADQTWPDPAPEAEPETEPDPPKLLRPAIIAGAATLAVIIAGCVWLLSPSAPPEFGSQAPASGGQYTPPGEMPSAPSAEAPTSEPAEPVAATGVGAVKAVIANQLKAGQIQAGAAAALNDRLDEIARFRSRGQTKQVNDRIALLKNQLAVQRQQGAVTADGYDAILTAINKL